MTTTDEDVHDVHPQRQKIALGAAVLVTVPGLVPASPTPTLAVGLLVRSRRQVPVVLKDGFRTPHAVMAPEE